MAFVLVVVILSRSFQKNAKSAQPPSPPSIPVVTAVAKIGNQPIYLIGLGTVTPFETVTVRSRVDGQLMSVGVKEGQVVSADDVIAQIDPRPFEVQLLQAQGQLERDQATLANARVDLQRYTILYSQDSIPKQQLDTQISLVNQLEAAVKSDQGLVEAAKLQLVYARITAPVSGRVGLREMDPEISCMQPTPTVFSSSQSCSRFQSSSTSPRTVLTRFLKGCVPISRCRLMPSIATSKPK